MPSEECRDRAQAAGAVVATVAMVAGIAVAATVAAPVALVVGAVAVGCYAAGITTMAVAADLELDPPTTEESDQVESLDGVNEEFDAEMDAAILDTAALAHSATPSVSVTQSLSATHN